MWPEIASIGFHTHCTGIALNLQELNNLVFFSGEISHYFVFRKSFWAKKVFTVSEAYFGLAKSLSSHKSPFNWKGFRDICCFQKHLRVVRLK